MIAVEGRFGIDGTLQPAERFSRPQPQPFDPLEGRAILVSLRSQIGVELDGGHLLGAPRPDLLEVRMGASAAVRTAVLSQKLETRVRNPRRGCLSFCRFYADDFDACYPVLREIHNCVDQPFGGLLQDEKVLKIYTVQTPRRFAIHSRGCRERELNVERPR